MPHMAPMNWMHPIIALSVIMYIQVTIYYFSWSSQALSHKRHPHHLNSWPW